MRLIDREHYGPAVLLIVAAAVAVWLTLQDFVVGMILGTLLVIGTLPRWLPWKDKWTIAFSSGVILGLIVAFLWWGIHR